MKLFKTLAVAGVAAALALSISCKKTPMTPDTPTPDPTPTPAAAALSSLAVSPTEVTGDGTSTGTVTMTAAAPSGGASLSLSSGDTAASVPASATVLAGATTQTFTVRTFAPSADRTVTISASYAGVTKTADLLVRAVTTPPLPPPAASIAGHWTGTLNPCASCPGSAVSIVVDIVQSGSTYTGQCTHGAGAPGALTGFHLVTTASNYQDFLGSCLSGSVDARFFPGDDYISWIWKSDYTAHLTRH